MNFARLGLAFALCGLIALPAQAENEAIGRAVKPGQSFAGPLLDVHAPASDGWILAGIGTNGIGFARRAGARDESDGAQVVLFLMPPTQGQKEFLEAIRSRVETTNPPPRFAALETNYEYSERRGYPCVRFEGTFDDREALTTAGTRVTMKLQVIALYCRHPAEPQAGFFAAYSHRGAGTIADLGAPAQQFIDGIQVPPPGKAQ